MCNSSFSFLADCSSSHHLLCSTSFISIFCKVVNATMTSNDTSSRHGNDTVRTTPVRNPLNIERLSTWIVNHPSPVLQSLIFGAQGRSTQDEHWLQERMEVKQFGKSLNLRALYLMHLHTLKLMTLNLLCLCHGVPSRIWTIKSNLPANPKQLASSG